MNVSQLVRWLDAAFSQDAAHGVACELVPEGYVYPYTVRAEYWGTATSKLKACHGIG